MHFLPISRACWKHSEEVFVPLHCDCKALLSGRVLCVWRRRLASFQGSFLLGCRPESGSMPDVDKAWYRLLSAHSVCTQRKESIRVSAKQSTLIFDF